MPRARETCMRIADYIRWAEIGELGGVGLGLVGLCLAGSGGSGCALSPHSPLLCAAEDRERLEVVRVREDVERAQLKQVVARVEK